ncbi:hypothetical protein SEA_LABELLE_85 [Mycobacterium phage Labelle]|nr:hypothetical protein SEA_LABELLE_85 [Mycobacterium phage Labelle]
MAKFNLGINLGDSGVAQAREAWSGELPPTGSYDGVLKVISIGEIGPEAKNAGKPKLSIGVELRAREKGSPNKKYDGFIAWGNLNLIESAAPFINQFLLALTDGSDESLAKIQHDFENNMQVDERKKHVLKIGKLNINSPEGETPIKVSLKNTPFTNTRTNVTTQRVEIASYLLRDDAEVYGGGVTTGPTEEIIEEETPVTVDLEDDGEVYEGEFEESAEPEDAESLLD